MFNSVILPGVTHYGKSHWLGLFYLAVASPRRVTRRDQVTYQTQMSLSFVCLCQISLPHRAMINSAVSAVI